MTKILFFMVTLLLTSNLFAAAGNGQRLVIPVPDASGIPKDRIRLTINIPEKIEVIDDIPKSRRRTKSTAWDKYDFSPFKTIPRRDFIFNFFNRCIKKGVLTDFTSKAMVKNRVPDESMMLAVLRRAYNKLVEIKEHDALRKFRITITDLEDFQEVIELLKGRLHVVRLNQINMNSKIDEMIGFLRTTSGKGHLRIVEVKEKPDGSTVLELEILKGE